MPFRYSAFLSYRHPKGDLAAGFVTSLYESLAAKFLEKYRLEALPVEERQHGLIIPIILRGLESVPAELQDRQSVDFSNFLSTHSLRRRSDYARQVSQLADYIASRCEVFRALPRDLFAEAKSFALPDKNAVIQWIHQNRPGTPELQFLTRP
jgi:hypothetical protein